MIKQKKIDIPDLKFNYIIYEDGTIYNEDSKRYVRPFKDKRRPEEPPLIYLKTHSGRFCIYHNELIAMMFKDDYDPKRMSIKYKDGDLMNSSFSNLVIGDGFTILKDFYGETMEWKCINEVYNLYYEYYISEDGRLFNGTTGQFVKPFADKRERNKGYLRYNLYRSKDVNDIMKKAASRLVAEVFIQKPDDKDIVILIDGDNNNLKKENLYWGDNYDLCCKYIEYNRELTSIETHMVGKEKWKTIDFIKDLGNHYIVSTYGRVYNKTRNFYVSQFKGPKNPSNQAYKYVSLRLKNNSKISVSVHRLVAFAFIKNDDPMRKTDVNHINGNPECNLTVNLEWVTPYQNLHHALETNLHHSSRFKGKVTDEQ